tara:strand:- start:342 stop:521 length:180 start_codon:yes stop_codon:yes gene_type:complete
VLELITSRTTSAQQPLLGFFAIPAQAEEFRYTGMADMKPAATQTFQDSGGFITGTRPAL